MIREVLEMGLRSSLCLLVPSPAEAAVANLALRAAVGTARACESAPVVAGHEPAKANDGLFRTYWLLRPENLSCDLGIEWPEPRSVSNLIVRYHDGRMVRDPAIARSQQWARLEYWDGRDWKPVEARILGQETSSVRYLFAPVVTSRIRLLFTLGIDRVLDLMAGQELTYPIRRMGKGGFVSALETIYWNITIDTLTYYQAASIPPGGVYRTEKAAVGVYRNRGEITAGWDQGVREWITEYHAQVSPLPPAWLDACCEAWPAKFGVRGTVKCGRAISPMLRLPYPSARLPTSPALTLIFRTRFRTD